MRDLKTADQVQSDYVGQAGDFSPARVVVESTATGGDLAGTVGSATVTALRGKPLPALAPGFLYYDGAAWLIQASGGSGSNVTDTDWMWPKTSAVPAMTSNTAPSGVASASSYYSTTPAWGAFDADHTGWLTDGTGLGTPQWLQYQFASAKTIRSYSIQPWSNDNWPGRWITGWHLDGSNDGSTWTTLDTRTRKLKRWVPFMPAYFDIATPASYLYYRLVITANGGNAYVGIQRLELYES